ncbi:unnamed protein product [Knipowitschia caucasica]
MAESGPEKTQRLAFAERQLLRHGWEHGKGLGRDEKGISEAIKVKVKCDKGGLGHKEGDQFTFHWWDHVFNQTSASLQVESSQGGTTLKSNGQTQGSISSKIPLKASLAKDKLYGAFVKSATVLSGTVENTQSNSSCSSDEEDLDLSSVKALSDAALVKACGGRTAHKGARHGLKMSAKLARLEQQEAEFMAKYEKTRQSKERQVCEVTESTTCLNAEEMPEVKRKKKNRVKAEKEIKDVQEATPPPKRKKSKE